MKAYYERRLITALPSSIAFSKATVELLVLFYYQHPDRLAAIGVESVWAFSYHRKPDFSTHGAQGFIGFEESRERQVEDF